MKSRHSMWVKRAKWIAIFLIVSACIDRIRFDVPSAQLQIVVEGMISDEPGPYSVKVSKGLALDADTTSLQPVRNLAITLLDDNGNSEAMTEMRPGFYQTSGSIRGQIGRSYRIRLVTPDGKIFESEPEKMTSSGNLEAIRYEYEPRVLTESFGEVAANVFNITIDGKIGPEDSNFIRWRYKGTYRVITYPELNYTFIPGYTPYKDPFPCSGYFVGPGPEGSGGILIKFAECSCCICWPSESEDAPQLSDAQLITDGQFKNIKVGEVPINSSTFYDKYLVEVEQMSLSRKAFDFFKLVREQKVNASSLFQPPLGELRGNIKAINTNDPVVGIFWATSIKKKSLFLYPSDVPYPLTEIEFSTLPCYRRYKNATNTQPASWQ